MLHARNDVGQCFHPGENVGATNRVLFHDLELFIGKGRRLAQDPIVDADLADIVQ